MPSCRVFPIRCAVGRLALPAVGAKMRSLVPRDCERLSAPHLRYLANLADITSALERLVDRK